LEIWHDIAPDSLQNANRVSEKLEEAINELVRLPGQGHTRSDVKNPRLRLWSVFSHVIAYWYDDTSLTVERVVHGRRNFRRLFKR
jgi:plasmid stabilization system protein ParE